MKKLLVIVVLGLLLTSNAYSEIINLRCEWNSGYSFPEEDMSSNRGKVDFYKIDLKKKKVLDSPSGTFENEKTELSRRWFNVSDNTISFGVETKLGMRRHSHRIDRNTGVLKETHYLNAEELKGMVVNNYLCEKTTLKKKF